MAKAAAKKAPKKARKSREPATYVPMGAGSHYNLRADVDQIQKFRDAFNAIIREPHLQKFEKARLDVERRRAINGVPPEPRLGVGSVMLMSALVGLPILLKQWAPPGK